MRGLQPFYRGLYRLASRGSRTAAAVGSRVEFCGTQTSAKVRNDRPSLCLFADEEAPKVVFSFGAFSNFVRLGCFGTGGGRGRTPGAAAPKTLVFPAQKRAQKKSTSVKAQTQLELMPEGDSFSSRVSGCLLWFQCGRRGPV